MAGTQFAHLNFRLIADVRVSFWRRSSAAHNYRGFLGDRSLEYKRVALNSSKLTVGSSVRAPKPTVNVEGLVDFLYEDLGHLFDDQGIDRSAYDERIRFEEPITKFESLNAYLFNISLLKTVFRPQLQLHFVKQTGPFEITTRWTVVMEYMMSPWKPEMVITGTSTMGINPETGKFCSHVDKWDSIRDNNFFSLEGLWHIMKQMSTFKSKDLGTPKYQILKRMTNYEVRKYDPLVALKGTDLPDTHQFTKGLKESNGGIAAAIKFSGKPSKNIVQEKVKTLFSNLVSDGLRPKTGCLLSPPNDSGPWNFAMENEVLIWLEDFSMG
ncbi:uncharacterized protein LOC133796970 [Humulus lupulus]|uniref:uncharacterized protein LOC133796970 n=1 Tax=Humulus lupulus TaxID=3486 RepID=UPI002B411B00|nr:uncharacterized protein LOC133796970 [Humulus lupulus]